MRFGSKQTQHFTGEAFSLGHYKTHTAVTDFEQTRVHARDD